MPTTKVQVGTEEAFVAASYMEARAALGRAAVGSTVITTNVEAEGQRVLPLSGLVAWAEAAQRRADPEAADYLEQVCRRWRVHRGEGPALMTEAA